jgi:hypothetical protein
LVEYCSEVEVEAEVSQLKGWCFEFGVGNESGTGLGHDREDSGIGLEENFEGGGEFMDD